LKTLLKSKFGKKKERVDRRRGVRVEVGEEVAKLY
jgi:hypothetical protein